MFTSPMHWQAFSCFPRTELPLTRMARASLNRTSSGFKALGQASERGKTVNDTISVMAPATRTTPFLIYLVYIVTLGHLQFGFHLVSLC